eukprot:Amastigsp_a174612_161.p3 type:complete len:105 gc:universal Amastigsp_a174612_161:394-708(+)
MFQSTASRAWTQRARPGRAGPDACRPTRRLCSRRGLWEGFCASPLGQASPRGAQTTTWTSRRRRERRPQHPRRYASTWTCSGRPPASPSTRCETPSRQSSTTCS